MNIELPDDIAKKIEDAEHQRKRLEFMKERLEGNTKFNLDGKRRYDEALTYYINSLQEIVNDVYSCMTDPDGLQNMTEDDRTALVEDIADRLKKANANDPIDSNEQSNKEDKNTEGS